MELALDTSTDIATIALSRAGEVEAELTWHCGQNHTVGLMPNIIHLLRQVKASLQQLDAVVVAIGPGSFNGLRVGVGTAKGLAFALGVPLVGIGSLEVEAFPHARTGLPTCPVQDAGRGEVATALYQLQGDEWQRLMAEHITTVEELCHKASSRTIFCGRFSPHIAQQIEGLLGAQAVILSGTLRRAGFLAELGWRRLERGDYDHHATLQPLYLRRPAVTTKRETKR